MWLGGARVGWMNLLLKRVQNIENEARNGLVSKKTKGRWTRKRRIGLWLTYATVDLPDSPVPMLLNVQTRQLVSICAGKRIRQGQKHEMKWSGVGKSFLPPSWSFSLLISLLFSIFAFLIAIVIWFTSIVTVADEDESRKREGWWEESFERLLLARSTLESLR